MKTKAFLAICAAAILSSCASHKQLEAGFYDERPVNKQPTLERPAWPNYDLHNTNSFAVFTDVQPAELRVKSWEDGGANITYVGDGVPIGEYNVLLHRCKDATYVECSYTVPKDWWFFRNEQGTMIIDADTGDRYMLRYVEHFPMNQCYWIHGMANRVIKFVCVYPPLPASVKHIQFFEPDGLSRKWMDGNGTRSQVFDVDDLRPKAPKSATHAKTNPRVIY